MDQSQPAGSPQLLVEAVCAFQARELEQAELLCRQLLLVEPQNADALHVLGLALSQSGRSDLAIDPLRSASDLQPENAVLWCNLGTTYCNLGQFAAAAECQRRAIAI